MVLSYLFRQIYFIIHFFFSFCSYMFVPLFLPFPTTSTKYDLFLAVLDHIQSTFIKLSIFLSSVSILSSNLS